MKKSTNHIAWNVMESMTTNCTPARMFVMIVRSMWIGRKDIS